MSKGSPNLVLRLPGDLQQRVRADAVKAGVSVSEFVRCAIENQLAANRGEGRHIMQLTDPS